MFKSIVKYLAIVVVAVALTLSTRGGAHSQDHHWPKPYWMRWNNVCLSETQGECFMPRWSKHNEMGHKAHWVHWINGDTLCVFFNQPWEDFCSQPANQ